MVTVADENVTNHRGRVRSTFGRRILDETEWLDEIDRIRLCRITSSAAEARMATLGAEEWPRSLNEAVERLLTVLSEDSKRVVRGTAESDLIRFHFPWGQGIRNDYGMWRGNRELLESCGGGHPDDASMVIIRTVWRRLQDAEPGDAADPAS
jgi:hypothetical protein